MKKTYLLFIIFLLVCMFACHPSHKIATNTINEITTYSVCQTDVPLQVYLFSDGIELPEKIYPGRDFIVKERKGEYWAIMYGDIIGYIKATHFKSEIFFPATAVLDYQYKNNKYIYTPGYSNTASKNTNTSGSKSYVSSGGPVQVKGYTRKNGTYVAPYTRSAPSRRH